MVNSLPQKILTLTILKYLLTTAKRKINITLNLFKKGVTYHVRITKRINSRITTPPPK